VANKNVFLAFGDGPVGVSRICSDNTQSRLMLGWEPQIDIETGLEQVYPWVANQVLTSS
jgi:nucleoside-diphosphate-sugar epimerase